MPRPLTPKGGGGGLFFLNFLILIFLSKLINLHIHFESQFEKFPQFWSFPFVSKFAFCSSWTVWSLVTLTPTHLIFLHNSSKPYFIKFCIIRVQGLRYLCSSYPTSKGQDFKKKLFEIRFKISPQNGFTRLLLFADALDSFLHEIPTFFLQLHYTFLKLSSL